MSESEIQKEIRLALGRREDVVLWRNNVGVMMRGGTYVRYGLCVGSADLIGIYKPTGQFLAIEVKEPGKKTTPDQKLFAQLVVGSNALYACVTSAAQAVEFIETLAGRGDE